jgi:hypothetical protein
VVLVLLTTSSILAVPYQADLGGLVAAVPDVVVPPILATIAFVVPLTGVQRALADQKERLEDAAQVRLRAALASHLALVDGHAARLRLGNPAPGHPGPGAAGGQSPVLGSRPPDGSERAVAIGNGLEIVWQSPLHGVVRRNKASIAIRSPDPP